MPENILDHTLSKRFPGLTVPQGALFYPCCGDDLREPIELFADLIDEYHFVDIQQVPKLPDFEGVAVSPPEPKECEIGDAAKAALMRLGEEQWRHVRGKAEMVAQRLTLPSESPRALNVFRYRQDGLTAFIGLDKIAVFFLRRDSMGEGGSGQMWFQPKLFDLILEKLVDGGLIVTDGSGAPYGEERDHLPWKPLWTNNLRRAPGGTVSPENFSYAGRDFQCVGMCGRGYGPVYVWRVGEFRASRLRNDSPLWIRDLTRILRDSGMVNAGAIIETISNFLALREMESFDPAKLAQCGDSTHWNELLNLPEKELFQRFQKEIPVHRRELSRLGIEVNPRSFEFKNAKNLYEFIKTLDKTARQYERDVSSIPSGKARLYEDLLVFSAEWGGRGLECFTPRNVVRLIVGMMEPKPGEVIGDPACGTGGFLVESLDHMISEAGSTVPATDLPLYGFDNNMQAASFSALNVMLHGGDPSRIYRYDSLSTEIVDRQPVIASDAFDLIMTDPPIGSSIDFHSLDPSLLPWAKHKRNEVAMTALILRMLKKDGRAAMIVPPVMFFSAASGIAEMRRRLLEENQVDAIVTLPAGTFPGTSISLSILVFRKGGRTTNVFFCDLRKDEQTASGKTDPLPETVVDETIDRWKQWRKNKRDKKAAGFTDRTSKCFVVPFEEIAAGNYELSMDRYREVVVQTAEFVPSAEIFAKLKAREQEVLDNYKKLEEYLES